MTNRVARAVPIAILLAAACSNKFVVLEERPAVDRDGAVDRPIDASPSLDARAPDTAVQGDATLLDPRDRNVVSGFKHTCAVVQGSLYCWGWDLHGQVGVVGDRNQLSPVKLGNDVYSDVCAGEEHSCALRADGTTLCWGGNSFGELGLGDTNAREQPTPIDTRRFVALACGGNNTCGLAADGQLWCWGDNHEGKLGQGDPPEDQMGTLPLSTTPIPVQSDQQFAKMGVGQGHVCALNRQGKLYCWGRNTVGQLGIDGTPAQTRTPLPALGSAQYVAIAAGQFHSCAIDSAGKLSCWGKTLAGLLGVPTDQTMLRAPTLLEGDDWESVSVNWFHSCALKKDATLYCWGRGEEGQLGGGDSSERDTPTRVAGDARWRSVGAGQFHTCAFGSEGLSCWGANDTGQLGLGDNARRYVPLKLTF